MVHCRLFAYGNRDHVIQACDHVIRQIDEANGFSQFQYYPPLLFQYYGPLLFQYHGPLEYTL